MREGDGRERRRARTHRLRSGLTETVTVKESTAYALLDRRAKEIRSLVNMIRNFDKEEVDKILTGLFEDLASQLPLQRIGGIDKEQFIRDYSNGPYHVLPCPEHEYCYLLYRMRHYPLDAGILDEFRSGRVFLCFHANRFTKWVSPLPEDISIQLDFPETIDAKVNKDGSVVTFPAKEALAAFNQYKHYLGTRISKTQWEVKPKFKWQFLCNLVVDGILPFTPQPVDPSDLREKPLQTRFELRPEQVKWHESFMEHGRVGNFAPMGEGKMYWGVWELCHMKPAFYIAGMPGTLEMWKKRIREDVIQADQLLSEIDFISLRQAERFLNKKKQYTLGIGDEFHRSPAPTHSPIFQVPVKYFIAETACVFGSTLIELENNTWSRIDDLGTPLIKTVKGLKLVDAAGHVALAEWGNRKALKITTQSNKTLKLTDDHPLLTLLDDGPTWQRAKNLREGDCVLCTSNPPITSEQEWLSIFYGFLLGEGHNSRQFRRLTITIGVTELDPVCLFLNRLGCDYVVHKKKGRNAFAITLRTHNSLKAPRSQNGIEKSKEVLEWLDKLGYPHGRKQDQPLTIPNAFEQPPLLDLSIFGLFGAEGTPGQLRVSKRWGSTYTAGPILAMNTKEPLFLLPLFERISRRFSELGIRNSIRISKTVWATRKVELRISSRLDNLIRAYHYLWFAFSPDKQRRANEMLSYCLLKNRLVQKRVATISQGVPVQNDIFGNITMDTISAWQHGLRQTTQLQGIQTITPPATSADVRWERIERVDDIEANESIFDLSVPTVGNFIANGFVSHNTPYREGPRGKEELALLMVMSHYPIEISWSEILKKRTNVPSIDVWVVKNWDRKMEWIEHLLSSGGGQHVPTILFTWELSLGDELVRRFAPKTEPITGLTPMKERIELAEKYLSQPPLRAVVSTVGSESWDLKQLGCAIEAGGKKGSRVEEIQRIGRMMHATYRGAYHAIYTEDEWVRFGWKRTMAAEEKGLLVTLHFEDMALEKLTRTVRPRLVERAYGRTTRSRISQGISRRPTSEGQDRRREIPLAITQRLPAGVVKILNELEATAFQVTVTMLANPNQSYGVLQLRHATGLSASTISGNAHFGKLRKEGLIKKVGKGQYQAAM